MEVVTAPIVVFVVFEGEIELSGHRRHLLGEDAVDATPGLIVGPLGGVLATHVLDVRLPREVANRDRGSVQVEVLSD